MLFLLSAGYTILFCCEEHARTELKAGTWTAYVAQFALD